MDDTADSGPNIEDAVLEASPLASLGGSADSGGGNMSPLTQLLVNKSQEIMPSRPDVEAKRAGLQNAYQNLIAAQRYRGSAVKDPGAVAFASQMLGSSGNPELTGLGKGLESEMGTRQAFADRQAEAEQNQGKTGLAANEAQVGNSNEDLKTALQLLQTAGNTDYRNTLLGMKGVHKDQNGNLVMIDANGNAKTINANGGAAGTAQIPGVIPGSPIAAGISKILADNGIDSTQIARTRPELAESSKESAAALSAHQAATLAAQKAALAKVPIEGGYVGGPLSGITGPATSMLPASAQPQWQVNRNLIDKYNKDIASTLASSMHNSRIGIGMDKFLSGTTFSGDNTIEANKEIINNIQHMPKVTSAGLQLEAYTNKLPQNMKDIIYNEFLKDNPPYQETKDADGKSKFNYNPVYDNPKVVQQWLASRATGQVQPNATNNVSNANNPNAPTISREDALAEAKRRGLIK